MTKIELLNEFSLFEDFESKAQAGRAFDHLFGIIKAQLVAGNPVALGTDFGSFTTETQAARAGKVPGSEATYSTPAKQVVKFKVSAPLKALVAGN